MSEFNKPFPQDTIKEETSEIPTEPEARLEYFKPLIQAELDKCSQIMAEIREKKERNEPVETTPFDARSRLYELAIQLAGEARHGDIESMLEFVKPLKGEISADVSAGTGFLTIPMSEATQSTVYAIDPSEGQLTELRKHAGENVVPVRAWTDNEELMFDKGGIPRNALDFATSFGGVHHINIERYQEAFNNIASMLKPGGRFAAADVPANSILQRHFDEVVEYKCLTGHDMGQFMSPELLQQYADGAGMTLESAEIRNLTWDFNSEEEMAWFFKGLHAYPQPAEEVAQDLKDTLGYEQIDGKYKLNWPMLFWDIRKPTE